VWPNKGCPVPGTPAVTEEDKSRNVKEKQYEKGYNNRFSANDKKRAIVE
jgi:hypothetical protein